MDMLLSPTTLSSDIVKRPLRAFASRFISPPIIFRYFISASALTAFRRIIYPALAALITVIARTLIISFIFIGSRSRV